MQLNEQKNNLNACCNQERMLCSLDTGSILQNIRTMQSMCTGPNEANLWQRP